MNNSHKVLFSSLLPLQGALLKLVLNQGVALGYGVEGLSAL